LCAAATAIRPLLATIIAIAAARRFCFHSRSAIRIEAVVTPAFTAHRAAGLPVALFISQFDSTEPRRSAIVVEHPSYPWGAARLTLSDGRRPPRDMSPTCTTGKDQSTGV
jgi:hypothetical protein